MKPRLLIIVGRFVIGGHATDNIPLLFHLKDKYTIKIIYGEKEADEIEPLFLLDQFPGLDLQKITSLKRSINPFADIATFYKIYKSIKNFKPDIVHTHGAKSGFTGRIAARLYGQSSIIHTFHGHLFHSYFNKIVTQTIIRLERFLASITDAAIALSPSQKKELVERFKIFPAHKVYEIPLGLFEPAERMFYKREFRKEFSLSEDDVAIAIIGRIVPIKNHLDFLKIAKQIIEKGFKQAKFFVIGDGSGRQEMIEYLQQNNIPFSLPGQSANSARIIFTSWIPNIYEVLYNIDIVVLTSLNEGTPVSLIEAQLCGKPVIAYNVGGVKDTITDNETGFLVEQGDTFTFAERLIQLVKNKELRKTMGDAGRKFSSVKFSKHTEVALMDDLYSKLLLKKQKA